MSFVITSTASVFTNPTTVPFLQAGSSTTAVNATSPVQLGGTNATYTTVATTGGAVQNVVVSGLNTRLNAAPGASNIQVTGGGAIVESIQGGQNAGGKTIALGDSSVAYNGGLVQTSASVAGNSPTSTATIASVAGNQGGNFAYYAHGGIGADLIEGSSLNDFIRGGAGDDSINGYGGNDVIRGGAGADTMYLGIGADTAYYTSDQFDGSVDRIVDFTTGVDKIAVSTSVVASTANIAGLGSNTVTLNGSNGKVTIVSGQSVINSSDINFV